MSKLPVPIVEPIIENPEAAVPVAVAYRGFQSARGIQDIYQRYEEGKSFEQAARDRAFNDLKNANSSAGGFIAHPIRRNATTATPAPPISPISTPTPSSSSEGTFLLHPPGYYPNRSNETSYGSTEEDMLSGLAQRRRFAEAEENRSTEVIRNVRERNRKLRENVEKTLREDEERERKQIESDDYDLVSDIPQDDIDDLDMIYEGDEDTPLINETKTTNRRRFISPAGIAGAVAATVGGVITSRDLGRQIPPTMGQNPNLEPPTGVPIDTTTPPIDITPPINTTDPVRPVNNPTFGPTQNETNPTPPVNMTDVPYASQGPPLVIIKEVRTTQTMPTFPAFASGVAIGMVVATIGGSFTIR